MSRLAVGFAIAICSLLLSLVSALAQEAGETTTSSGATTSTRPEPTAVDPPEDGVNKGVAEEFEVEVDPDVNPNNESVKIVVRSGTATNAPGRDGQPLPPGWECEFVLAVSNDLLEPVISYFQEKPLQLLAEGPNPFDVTPTSQMDPSNPLISKRLYSPSGQWAAVTCLDADGEFVDYDFFPLGGAPVTLGELFTEAVGELDPPVHAYEMRPEGKQLVQFPSLLWVDPAYWNQERTTTVGNGNVTLTVSLVPYETEWDPGDGSDPVVCDGPGDVYTGGDAEDFTCIHTYRTVEGQPFTMSSTVRFEVQWSTNSSEVLGPFGPLERIATTEVGVREIQVVETSG